MVLNSFLLVSVYVSVADCTSQIGMKECITVVAVGGAANAKDYMGRKNKSQRGLKSQS